MARGEAVRLRRGGEVSRSVEQVRDLFSSLDQVRKVRGLVGTDGVSWELFWERAWLETSFPP